MDELQLHDIPTIKIDNITATSFRIQVAMQTGEYYEDADSFSIHIFVPHMVVQLKTLILTTWK